MNMNKGKIDFKLVDGTELEFINENAENIINKWNSKNNDPPVPVGIEKKVWDKLIEEVMNTNDAIKNPRVFCLFMKKGKPRYVVETKEIEKEKIRINRRGIIRWEIKKYPARESPNRIGGICFIRGDVQLKLDDAWWMGRELTDLRILLNKKDEKTIEVLACWSRGSTSGNGTDGEVCPVKLIIS